jgi:hypothetical protein
MEDSISDVFKKYREHLMLLLRPTLVAGFVVALWVLTRYTLPFTERMKHDEDAMASGTINTIGIIYAILAGFVLTRVWDEWSVIDRARRTNNFDLFAQYKDLRVPHAIKFLLGVFSLALTASFFFISFSSLLTGAFTMFTVPFLLMVYAEVANDLDDPLNGICNINHIPEEWKKRLRAMEEKER